MHRIAWNVNGLAQVAGVIALNDTQHLRRAKNLIRKERKFMFQEIQRRLKSFSTIRSDVNFYLIDLHRCNSSKLRDYLLRWKGILVRDCSTFRGLRKNFIRVAIRNHHENVALLRSLESIDH
jgi:threonine-phosphate decarboxylase